MNTKVNVISRNLKNHVGKNYLLRKANENMKGKERII